MRLARTSTLGLVLWAGVALSTTALRGRVHRTPDPRVADAQMVAELAVAEDPRAIAAVAGVVLMRSRAGAGQTVRQVLTAPGQWGTWKYGVWMPSWPPSRAWSQAHREEVLAAVPIVAAVLDGRVPPPAGAATHFHRLGTWTPSWAPAPREWRIFGSHAFYAPRPAPQRRLRARPPAGRPARASWRRINNP